MDMKDYNAKFMDALVAEHQAQPEFHQAVREVVDTLGPCLQKHPEYIQHKIMERMVEPDRIFIFRVPWQDDKNEVQVNRGFRVEFSNAIGPYKGGLRFHPSVNHERYFRRRTLRRQSRSHVYGGSPAER